MQNVIFVFLVTQTLSFLIGEKLNAKEILMKSKYKIFHDLGKCDFCFKFWISILTTSLIYLTSLDVKIFVPIAAIGLWVTINEFKR